MVAAAAQGAGAANGAALSDALPDGLRLAAGALREGDLIGKRRVLQHLSARPAVPAPQQRVRVVAASPFTCLWAEERSVGRRLGVGLTAVDEADVGRPPHSRCKATLVER